MGIGAIAKPAVMTAPLGMLELTPGVARFGPFNVPFSPRTTR
jgi:hypothetical protein